MSTIRTVTKTPYYLEIAGNTEVEISFNPYPYSTPIVKTDVYSMRVGYLVRDADGYNPREVHDNVGRMVCWHRKYVLGDEQPEINRENYLYRLACYVTPSHKDRDTFTQEDVDRILREHYIILPIYLYDHSGIVVSTRPFYCTWDSGYIGFIYCTMKRVREEWDGDTDKARKYLEGEVEEYNHYLNGEVYGVVVDRYIRIDTDWKFRDSNRCWGFFGQGPAELALKELMQ